MKVGVTGLILVLLVAGCVSPGPSDPSEVGGVVADERCNPFYYVGCDDNPDADYMLETYGLHQFTNTTTRVARPIIGFDTVTWTEGGHGHPVQRSMMYLNDGAHHKVPSPPNHTHYDPYPLPDGRVVFGDLPRPEGVWEWNNASVYTWSPGGPKQVITTPEVFPYRPFGVSGGWVALWGFTNGTTHMGGAAAIRLNGEDFIELHPYGLPSDGSFFGTPLIDFAIGGGYMFLSMLWAFEEGQPNAIVQVDLKTGERKDILNVTGHSIQAMDASEDYLVLQANIDGRAGIWAWSIHDQEWFFVQEGRDRAAIHPKVGGDWVVYLEHQSEGYPSILVGYHIPTNSYYDLVIRYETDSWRSTPFGFISWDTDGSHVVAHIQINSTGYSSPFTFRGSQLYWMELPDADSVG